jgi:hypothetical protein
MHKNNVETIIYIMDSDEIYKFVGYAVIVLFFIYVISKTIRFNTRIIEGLENKSSSKKDSADQEKVKKDTEKLNTKENTLKDYLQIYVQENKDNYGNMMDSLYNVTNYRMIKLIIDNAENINNKPDAGETKAAINQIKDMKELMNTLSYAYKTLDSLSKTSKKDTTEEEQSAF